ncbi:BASS family bile acid:Na+ symporter [Rhodococcus sp. SMB37]|uniref:bile acid:sodium symporter family protein n=1 Tax=Rhodococcus sp. SMB37 TaxID=2512213 RepID=UPI00104DB51C|nr:bile acid:sodium symporter [Rhodococcus sp. SMB37]TCN42459.1 BASS family bile acid:Na+ symporter [Rhodococcus sp. SMB37]
MYEFFQTLGSWAVAVFVVTSMLNVGLTQKPSRVLAHLSNRSFLLRMILLNFVVVPALMIAAVYLAELETVYAAGLLLFSLVAGAPFLVELTNLSRSDVALAVTVLLVLMVGTIVLLPITLPRVLRGLTVDAWAVAQGLLTQMLLPMVIGMLLLQAVEGFVAVVEPWIARISSIALYVLIVAIVIGYLPAMTDPELWKAIGVGMSVLVLALFLGWAMGDGHGHLQEVGALGTAQRGTAAAMIVTQDNFDDSRVLVLITVLNTFGVVMLIVAAKLMSRDNRVDLLVPVAADVPERTRTQRIRT